MCPGLCLPRMGGPRHTLSFRGPHPFFQGPTRFTRLVCAPEAVHEDFTKSVALGMARVAVHLLN